METCLTHKVSWTRKLFRWCAARKERINKLCSFSKLHISEDQKGRSNTCAVYRWQYCAMIMLCAEIRVPILTLSFGCSNYFMVCWQGSSEECYQEGPLTKEEELECKPDRVPHAVVDQNVDLVCHQFSSDICLPVCRGCGKAEVRKEWHGFFIHAFMICVPNDLSCVIVICFGFILVVWV